MFCIGLRVGVGVGVGWVGVGWGGGGGGGYQLLKIRRVKQCVSVSVD